jgi:hypothetical protein
MIMDIKRTSWHCKISNLGSDFERWDDNLCRYFWRLVGKSPLLLAAMIILCAGLYGYFTSDLLIANTIMILFLLSCFILPVLVIVLIRRKLGKSPEMPYENIVAEYLSAKKRKVCPLIKYR